MVTSLHISRFYNKDQEVIQQGSVGYTTRIRRLYNKDQDVIRWIFLVSVLLSASIEQCFVSRMQDFHQLGHLGRVSPTRPSGPSWCSSCKVCLCVVICVLSPSHAIFFKASLALRSHDQIPASYWPSGHMIRSWPLIG